MTNLSSGLVVGQFGFGVEDGPDEDDEPDIVAARGTVLLEPEIRQAASATAEPNPVILWLAPTTGVLDSRGRVHTRLKDSEGRVIPNTVGKEGLRVLATDDPRLGVVDWRYKVTVRMTSPDGEWVGNMEPFYISVPSGAGSSPENPAVDLAHYARNPAVTKPAGVEQTVALLARAEAAATSAAASAAEAAAAAGSGGGTPGAPAPASKDIAPLTSRGPLGILKAALTLLGMGSPAVGGRVVIGFAGSSTTAGAGTVAAERWVNRLSAKITTNPVLTDAEAYAQRASLPLGVTLVNAGLNGASSATYLSDGRDTRLASVNPRLVVHTIGANDFGGNMARATYKANLLAAIDRINAAATGPVAHLLVHSYERYDIATPGRLWSDYRDVMASIAAERPQTVAFLDLADTFKAMGVPSTDPFGLIGTDKLHMTTYGHQLYASLMSTALDLTSIVPVVAPPPAQPPATIPTDVPAGALLTSDDFNRANGPLGNAPDGKQWYTSVGDITIVDGKARASAANAGAVLVTDATDVTVRTVQSSGTSQGILVRVNADGSGYYFMFSGGGQEYRFGKRAATGAFTALQGTGTAFTNVATARLEVTAKGNQYTCKVNGVTVLQVTDDTHLTGTAHGLVFANTVTGLDDFAVYRA